MLLIDEYLTWLEEQKKIHGENTIVFCQTGSFFEIYSWEETATQIKVAEEILDFKVAKKKTTKGTHYMVGFPIHSKAKHEKKLLANGYTIVYVEQVSKEPVVRNITNIVSPGTVITDSDGDNDDTLFASALIEEENENSYYLYVSLYDSTTGDIQILPIQQENNSSLEKVDYKINCIIEKYGVIEILRNTISNKGHIKLSTSKIYNKDKHYTNDVAKKEFNDSKIYQPEMLKKYFSNYNTVFLNIFENLELTFADKCEIGNLILMLNYLNLYHITHVTNLKKPYYSTKLEKNVLKTYNNVYDKFQIFSNNENSLFQILDKTLTNLGKKKLKNFIYNPSTNISELNNRYDSIDFLKSDNKLRELVKNNLKIIDLNRFYRKFSLGKIKPYNDIPNIVSINKKITNILYYFYKNNIQFDWIPNIEIFEKFKEYSEEISSIFCIENCKESLNNMSDSKNIFCQNISVQLDNLFLKKQNCFEKINLIQKELSEYIGEDIKLEYTDKDGYFLTTTQKRAQKLKKYNDDKNKFPDKQENNKNKLTITNTKNNVKIFNDNLKEFSNNIIVYYNAIQSVTAELITKYTNDLYKKYFDKYINEIINSITMIDVFHSCAVVAIENNYIRPILKEESNSKLKAESLRHPIIEKLLFTEKKQFIPNDIEISSDSNYLIYGVNSVGKSSLLKSIGISVIMAQAGMFVAAKKFILAPYQKIITRIGNVDNIYKSHSSFVCEMIEADNIVNHSDNKTLVIADEMCSSTEIESAENIVLSIIKWLNHKNSTFVFATHFYKLIEYVKDINGLNIAHLKVLIDANDKNNWNFDRKLTVGIPEIKNYGNLIASKIFKNTKFLKILERTKTDNKQNLKSKRSNYNNSVIMDKCKICGYFPKDEYHLPLHVHHISEQAEANENNYIDHFHKNTRANLVVLCEKCHKAVHKNEIIIEGYSSKISGNEELQYHFANE